MTPPHKPGSAITKRFCVFLCFLWPSKKFITGRAFPQPGLPAASVDDYGDDYGGRLVAFSSLTVIVAVVVNRSHVVVTIVVPIIVVFPS
jgi:hypothetical protein